MYTLGYSFRPWSKPKAIADGADILSYVRDTAREADIERRIRLGHRVKSASFSSHDARWTVEAVLPGGERALFTCGFLWMCSGYFDYDEGYLPDFAGMDSFAGKLVHPQFWPENLDHAGKRVVVIGSGATAVTIVPEMARTAAHVVMLQRSPTYMASLPSEDWIANGLRRLLPSRIAYGLTRWKNVLLQMFFFKLARARPEKVKRRLIADVRKQLGPEHDVETHFTPSYKPWDQRLCLVPDADLFDAIKEGRASIVTDHIERFTREGLKLRSGRQLKAGIIVTATGLKIKLLGGIAFSVDGERRDLSRTLSYKGMMFSDMPNLAYTFGYTNASWTLKADLTAIHVCRLLDHMDRNGFDIALPRRDPAVEETPFVDFSSGYIQRAIDILPKQGSSKPWKLNQNYALDLAALKFGRIDDGVMHFSSAGDRA
jgi:monooxygenase